MLDEIIKHFSIRIFIICWPKNWMPANQSNWLTSKMIHKYWEPNHWLNWKAITYPPDSYFEIIGIFFGERFLCRMKVSSEKWNEFCSIEEIYEWLGCEQITTESTNTESITIETTTTEIIRNESTTKETLKSYTIFWIIITIIVITIILMNAIVVFLVLYFRPFKPFLC